MKMSLPLSVRKKTMGSAQKSVVVNKNLVSQRRTRAQRDSHKVFSNGVKHGTSVPQGRKHRNGTPMSQAGKHEKSVSQPHHENHGMPLSQNVASSTSLKYIKCLDPGCKKLFVSQTTLRYHMAAHSKERPYACSLCQKTYKWEYNYNMHIQQNHPFKCGKCKLSFAYKRDLNLHVDVHNASKLKMSSKVKMLKKKNSTKTSLLQGSSFKPGTTLSQKLKHGVLDSRKSIKCLDPACKKLFINLKTMTNHMVAHSKERPHICTICQRSYKWEYNYNLHIQLKHAFQCASCPLSFVYQPHLNLHSCAPCKRNGTKRNEKKARIKKSFQKSSKVSVQNSSKDPTPKPDTFRVVQNIESSKLQKMKFSKYRARLDLPCPHCTKSFRSNYLLQRHMPVHANLTPTSSVFCSHCQKGFTLNIQLFRHMKMSHGEIGCTVNSVELAPAPVSAPRSLVRLSPAPEKPFEIFPCKQCGKHFFRQEALTVHARSHTEMQEVESVKTSDITDPDPMQSHGTKGSNLTSPPPSATVSDSKFKPNYQCHLCTKTLSSSKKFLDHIKLHSEERPYKCDIGDCNRAFVTLWGLQRHTNKKCQEHEASRSLTVTSPAEVSANVTNENLKAEVRVNPRVEALKRLAIDKKLKLKLESGSSPLSRPKQEEQNAAPVKVNLKKCDMCSKVFARPAGLRQHMKLHLDVRDFKCDFCDKAFFTKIQLVAHGSVHTGIKPFVCKLCYLGFDYQQSLKHHLKSHETAK